MLYMFVHGLTVVHKRPSTPGNPDQIEIVLPNVHGHVYKAGNWLAETPIEIGSVLELKNVTGGNAPITGTGFLVDVPAQYPVTQLGRAATIVLPTPKEVLGLTLAVGKAAILTTVPEIDFDSLADVLILVYDFAKETEVYLDKHYWQPYAVGGAMSLHVIATSEVEEGEEHIIATKAALAQIFQNFPGIEYPKNAPRAVPAPWIDARNNVTYFGDLKGRREEGGYILESSGRLAFSLAELEHPASRAQRLERLGRMHREKSRIEGLWERPDPLSGSCSCGSMSGN
jgi:hypothetical protein